MASSSPNNLREIHATLVGGRTLAEALLRDGISYAIFSQTHLYTRLARSNTPYHAGSLPRAKARGAKLFFLGVSLWGLARMLLGRPRVLIYGTDRMNASEPFDARMANVYRWLQAQRFRSAHLVHGTSEPGVYRRWWRRRGPVMYIEAFEIVARAISRIRRPAFAVPAGSDALIKEIFQRANVTAAGIPLLSLAFRIVNPEQFWLIDDTRYWHQIVMAARAAGVPTVLFQHGRFTQYLEYLTYPGIPAEAVPMPDSYIVWNDFWASRLKEISPPFALHPELIQPGGKPSIDQVPVQSSIPSQSGSLRVLVIHEPLAPGDQVRSFIERILALPDVSVTYKIRGDIPKDAQLASLNDVVKHPRFSSNVSIPVCELALGSYSTLLYELVQAGVPAALVGFSSLQADLFEVGLASIIDPESSDLREQLHHAAEIADTERQRRAGQLSIPTDIRKTCEHLMYLTYVRH